MRSRGGVIVTWLLILIASTAASIAVGDDYRNNFSLPNTDSERAFELLGATFPDLSGAETQIVFNARDGQLTDPEIRTSIETMLAEASELAHVSDIESPYDEQRRQAISDDGAIGFASVKFNQDLGDIETETVEPLIAVANEIDSDQLQVELQGTVIQFADAPPGPGDSTLIGVVAAAIILLISFGSVLAAGLPILTALLGLGTGSAFVVFGSRFIDTAEFSPQLTLMIGLGVGVDYALFILSRFREIYRAQGGNEAEGEAQAAIKELAIEQAMDRAGRAVVFAGITVIIALLGMFALGFEFLYGVAVAASLGVLFVLLTSLTVLPALLHFFGARVGRLGRRQRHQAAEGIERRGFWQRWIAVVERHAAIVALISGLLIIALAIPAFGIFLGSSDAGNQPTSKTYRQAYDLLAKGFGPGYNAPLLIAIQLPEVDDRFPADQLADALRETEGIASVERPRLSPGRSTATVTAYPTTSPQSEETTELVKFLRRDVIPSVEATTGATIYIGGATAGDIDFAKVVVEKLPVFIGIVVLLSALLLMVVFRSFVIPIQAAVMNLMSIGAAMGFVTLLFQEGTFGLIPPGPIEVFVPIMVFAIVFGLSMDYEVFLVSRIHEEWLHTGDHSEAIRRGLIGTGRVITAAAFVMVAVFGSFILGGERIIQLFGTALAVAVAIDALVIRVVLLPAVLELIGPATWAFPAWLDRLLPTLAVEPHEEVDEREPWGWRIRAFWATLLALLIAGGIVWIVLADEDEDDEKTVKVLAERGTVIAETSAPGSIVDPSQ
ncbi:MAG: MMPL family transporter, partial [Thermoleophilaceae bacterium]|nr:MMPL family transporter [Thermoleophilaceae bacterium]